MKKGKKRMLKQVVGGEESKTKQFEEMTKESLKKKWEKREN